MIETGSIIVIVLEYDPEQEKVVTRGAFLNTEKLNIPLIKGGNKQSHIEVFFNIPAKGVGFSGLVPKGGAK
jgi:hypothetical protein